MSGEPVILRNWSVIRTGNPYMAPELHSMCLHGRAENHPEFAPGTTVTTSPVVSVEGRMVKTRTRLYELEGEPAAEYRAFIESKGLAYDERNPLFAGQSAQATGGQQ